MMMMMVMVMVMKTIMMMIKVIGLYSPTNHIESLQVQLGSHGHLHWRRSLESTGVLLHEEEGQSVQGGGPT